VTAAVAEARRGDAVVIAGKGPRDDADVRDARGSTSTTAEVARDSTRRRSDGPEAAVPAFSLGELIATRRRRDPRPGGRRSASLLVLDRHARARSRRRVLSPSRGDPLRRPRVPGGALRAGALCAGRRAGDRPQRGRAAGARPRGTTWPTGALAVRGGGPERGATSASSRSREARGKTTTKELVAAGARGATPARPLAPEGKSQQPRSACRSRSSPAPTTPKFAVLEMGMSAPGEIAALSRLAGPRRRARDERRPVHLEFFRLARRHRGRAKGELYATLRPDAVAVVTSNDEFLPGSGGAARGPRVAFGREPSADIVLEAIGDRFVPGATLTYPARRDDAHPPAPDRGGACRRSMRSPRSDGPRRGRGRATRRGTAMGAVEPGPRGAAGCIVWRATLFSWTTRTTTIRPRSRRCSGRCARPRPRAGSCWCSADMLELGRDETALHREAGEQAAAAVASRCSSASGLARRPPSNAERSPRGSPDACTEPDAQAAARSVPRSDRPGGPRRDQVSRGVHLETRRRGGVLRARGEAA